MEGRVSGWIRPDGSWLACAPWEHIRAIKNDDWLLRLRATNAELDQLWDDSDEEKMRGMLGRLGLVKVCYHLVDADALNTRQLRTLQGLYGILPLESEVEFVGRIRLRLEVRILLKLRDADRLNTLGQFG